MNNKLSYKFSYHRRLPHIQPEGATFFVTSRLANSLPIDVIEKLHNERAAIDAELAKIINKHERSEQAYLASRRLFGKWDKALDESSTGIKYLTNQQIAKLVVESLHFRDGTVYDLIAYCIMQYLRQLRRSGRLKNRMNSTQAGDLLKNISQ